MTTYLTIITTALVLTQLIRLVQNAISLHSVDQAKQRTNYIVGVYQKLEKYIDRIESEEKPHERHRSRPIDSQCGDKEA